MAKAALRTHPESGDRPEWRAHLGHAVLRARQLAGLSLKEFADAITRDERQVARWEKGIERPQFDAIFAVEPLRQPMVIALCELAGAAVEIETVVRIRKIA